MKQANQIGKYTKKDDVLMAKAGKTFVTPNNKEYIFDYVKEGRRYIFIINYLGYKMRVKESDFNTTDIEYLLNVIEDANKEIEKENLAH
jgi:hypothetical protein